MIGLVIKQFIGANWLSMGLIAAGVFGWLGWDSSRKASWVETGKQEVRVEIEKANEKAARIGTSAARKSAATGVQMGVRRQRDPGTRDD